MNNKDACINFIICGTQKGGTSALYEYLREHPEICMAKSKEVHFFDNEAFFSDGTPDYSIYHSSFNPYHTQKIYGEATPIYMYWHDAPRRIWEYNPNMKIIVILRNPIDRAYSHWNMERCRKAESLPFWDAIRYENERCFETLPYQHRVFSYVDRGFYSEQLRRLWFYFGREKVLILKNENLRYQLQKTLNEICEFIGIRYFNHIHPKEVHSYNYLKKMSHKEKEYLRYIYEYDIKNIERLLGWDTLSAPHFGQFS
jgi:hypothetical protein